jgi:spore maturation protein CgeB
MDIAFFGATLVSAYANGAATYFRGLLRALDQLGHRVVYFEPADMARLSHRDIVDPDWVRIVRFDLDGAGVEAAIDEAAQADVVVKSSSIGYYDELLNIAVPHAIRGSGLSVYWELNPAITLESLRKADDHPLREVLPWYDVVITRYGGASVLDEFQESGARVCFPIYNAVDPQVHYPVPVDLACRAALLFLGHQKQTRDGRLFEYFVEAARSLPNHRFILGGGGWEGTLFPPNIDYPGYVYTNEHKLYYSAATAALNVTDETRLGIGYAPSARMFEAIGCGACVITDDWDGLSYFFDPGQDVLVADSGAEVVERLLTLSNERAALLGTRARDRALTDHTYLQRATELEALLEGFDSHWTVTTAL